MSIFAKELAELSKLQSEALHKARYTGMTTEEIASYDLRRGRIAELCKLLEGGNPTVFTPQPVTAQKANEGNHSRAA